MKAYVFTGQGAQFSGMGKDLYEDYPVAKEYFEKANEILGFRITDIMFSGSDEELKQTKVTQPAVFLHSVIQTIVLGNDFEPAMVAGHSLLGLADEIVEKICNDVNAQGDIVVAANYNCPGQVVISGTVQGVNKACEALKAAGAKRALPLNVSGAFHSPLMQPAKEELEKAINGTTFNTPRCPVYQNVDAQPHTSPEEIKTNLIAQLTAPVRWTSAITNMINDGATEFIECGPGNVQQGLIAKIRKSSGEE